MFEYICDRQQAAVGEVVQDRLSTTSINLFIYKQENNRYILYKQLLIHNLTSNEYKQQSMKSKKSNKMLD